MENYTIFSYVFLLAIGCGIYYQYIHTKRAPVRAPASRPEPTRKEKSRKIRDKKTSEQPRPPPATLTSSYQRAKYSSDDDGVDNKDFARRLEETRNGTKPNVMKKTDDKRVKSVKQSRAQEKDLVAEKPSAPSSTTGIDADDDQSAEPSPVVQPADVAGISDMLETPSPGPGILRLTDTDKATQGKPKKVAQNAEPMLTKKQRQNKKKAEQKKAIREEEEKERKQKLEAQRRLARISEGRAAPDGSAFVARNMPTAWETQPSYNRPTAATSITPLDTFDQDLIKHGSASSDAEWIKTLPSEEEQIERVLQEAAEEEWATVESKSTKRKQRKETDGPKTADSTSPGSGTNGSPAKAFANQSSFAALNTGSDPAEQSDELDVKVSRRKIDPRPAVKAKTAAVETEWDI